MTRGRPVAQERGRDLNPGPRPHRQLRLQRHTVAIWEEGARGRSERARRAGKTEAPSPRLPAAFLPLGPEPQAHSTPEVNTCLLLSWILSLAFQD